MKKLSTTKRSLLLLAFYTAAILAAVFLAHVLPSLLANSGCAFYRITGRYCLTCGVTRATYALFTLQIGASLLQNPLPVILATLWVVLVAVEIRNLIVKKTTRFNWIGPFAIAVVVILLVHCILRNLGIY